MAAVEAPRKSDLAVRTASAIVMVAVAGSAFWLGGAWWMAFVAVIGLGVMWEWIGLVGGIARSPMSRGLWNATGLIYLGLAMAILVMWRLDVVRAGELLALMAAVVATDVFAYGFGRAIGGPKIAPWISPSKTWAGLLGGMIGASTVMIAAAYHQYYEVWRTRLGPNWNFEDARSESEIAWGVVLASGVAIAVIAQAGDFFESWMKRRAGVKDSGTLLPGHGGLFDRVDGLMAVLFVTGALFVAEGML